FRPSNGQWFILNSSSNTASIVQFGLNGDIPVDGDFDGDSRNDVGVFRPSDGTWFILPSSSPNDPRIVNFGLTNDVPVPGDYDRDGRTDIAVWRPSIGDYFIRDFIDGPAREGHWGLQGDIPIKGSAR